MHIERLQLRHFRNLAPLDLTSHAAAMVVLYGGNGQGKTNVLEALYLCATGRSFRHATALEMRRHDEPVATVTALFSRQGVRHEVAISLQQRQRFIRVDGRALRQSTRLLELLNVVAFFPDDLRVIKGSPEERRRFLDRAVANGRPEFVEAALGYHQALRARNALLRAATAPDRAVVDAYDAQLVRFGTVIQACRESSLAALLPAARQHFAALMPQQAELDITLTTGLTGLTASHNYGEAFAQTLRESYPRDRARGMTLCGPHRVDMVCRIAAQDSRLFASQGQQRALVLALKLAEVVCLRERLGSPPILLLDDVSSELDAERTTRLFKVVQGIQSQVWVTTTGAVPLPVPETSQRWRVENGVITPFSDVTISRTARASA